MPARDAGGRFVSGGGHARVRVVDHGYAALSKRVTTFARPSIAVGILEKDAETPAESDDGDSSTTLLMIAIWNEFGTGRIPPRSFIAAWADANEAAVQQKIAEQMRLVLTGALSKEQALERVGLWCVAQIQARMAEGIEPANAASTVLRKGSSTPLIHTGQLRSAVAHAIRGSS